MTWDKPDGSQWPTPLLERKGGLGKLVRQYVQDSEEQGGDEAAYQRLMAGTGRAQRRGGRRFPIAAMVLAASCGAVLTAIVVRHRATPEPPLAVPAPLPRETAPAPLVRTPELPPPAAAKPTTPTVTALRLHAQAIQLPAGKVSLDGQAVAMVSADGAATGRAAAQDTEIALGHGDIELEVLPRPPGHRFSVRAGLYRFTVVGTAFTVSRTRSRIELVVRKGKVAVSRAGKRLAMVAAGEQWAVELPGVASTAPVPAVREAARSAPAGSAPFVAGPVVPAPAASLPATSVSPAAPAGAQPSPTPSSFAGGPVVPAPRPSERPAPAPPSAADCRQLLTRQRTAEALLCYQGQSAQGGLAGETAQYELARLWRDSFGDLGRALAAFRDQRARFPGGALRIEADLSIIELLPRLGRHDDALAETERFLADHPKAERRGAIRLLRGNIFREVLHDLARAEREYAQGAESGGGAADDCRFLRAVCLEGLDRVAEARAAYRAYLLGSKTAHAQEVKKRLARLPP